MPSVTGKRVLIFGDSMSSGSSSPGAQMAQVLEAHGAITKIDAVVGRSAWNFYTTRENSAAVISDCNAFGADLAIVQLGSNDIGLGAGPDKAAFVKLRADLERAGHTEVWAIGPPSFAHMNPDATEQIMRDVFGIRFIDWRPLSKDMTSSPPRTADGVHFTAAGGQVAGGRLASAFMDASGGGIFLVMLAGLVAWAILR